MRCRFDIVARQDFSDVTYLLEVFEPRLARAARPGQFVMVMSHERGERIPLTLADFDAEAGTITLVIQAVGKTTRDHAAVGPMGAPSPLEARHKALVVGGGLGVAPAFPQARGFKAHGAYVIGVLGFRTQAAAFLLDKFASCCDEVVLCTDDGSAGLKGNVTAGIERAIAAHPDIEECVAIGPPIMMKACANATRPHRIRTTVSLNPLMIDGTGMCGGCRVKVGGRVKFACVDGPDFDAHEVDFDDLSARLRRFATEERVAMDRWTETCRMASPPAPLPH
jgi:NAD(P)H-flavin reductase